MTKKPIQPHIDGLTINNYPVIDGSTSTFPLNTVIACELLGLNYEWQEKEEGYSRSWFVNPKAKGSLKRKLNNVVKSSQTHPSIVNLIDREANLVLSARKLSPDEREYAQSKGVSVIETPISIDAFIFIINPRNLVNSLTIEEIQGIYTGKITEWKSLVAEMGQHQYSPRIQPYIRERNSGSQELMDVLVMKGLEYYANLPIYQERLVFTMAGLLDEIATDPYGIGYTIYYYNEQIIRPGDRLKTIAINGVQPTKESIANRSYPLTTEVYAIIRSDMDKTSMTYKIHEWLQTTTGKQVITKSGYIPN
ncbi:MAG: PstS family phosphate ABC transporter substrate-binding protein [Fermentimonas sp.]